jgi:hypothetical protein
MAQAGINVVQRPFYEGYTMDNDPNSIAQMAQATSHHMAQILALSIPIVAIVMGIGLAMLGLWFDYRKKKEMFELHHKERMAAIEKGVDVPPLPAEFFQITRRQGFNDPAILLRRGLILLLAGVALIFAASYSLKELSFWGLIPAAVGLAYLISYLVERKRSPAGGDQSHSSM